MNTIVTILKRKIRDKEISHAEIAERTGKHRTFITRKLNGDSMETRLLEQIMEATGITYQELLCNQNPVKTYSTDLSDELESLRQEISMIKEDLQSYKSPDKK